MSKGGGALVGLGALIIGIFAYKKRKAKKEEENERNTRLREIAEEEERIRQAKLAEDELKRDTIFKSIEASSNERLVERMNELVEYYGKHGYYMADKKEHIKPRRTSEGKVYEYTATLTFKKRHKR